jgi:hypothetical protein
MWVWREESVRGGWRLDSTGSWTYDEPARLERVRPPRPREAEPERVAQERIGQERMARERAAQERIARERMAQERFARAQRERVDLRRPALTAVPPLEATPIFRSVAHEARAWHEERPGYETSGWDHGGPAIPEPHPGSGPFPAPGRGHGVHDGGYGRGVGPVDAVPPPSGGWDDEVRRRAERRRRPTSDVGGRDGYGRQEPESGRHVLRR